MLQVFEKVLLGTSRTTAHSSGKRAHEQNDPLELEMITNSDKEPREQRGYTVQTLYTRVRTISRHSTTHTFPHAGHT